MKTGVLGAIIYILFTSVLFSKSSETVLKSRGHHLFGTYDLEIGIADFDSEFLSAENLQTFRGVWNLENENGIYWRQSVLKDWIRAISVDSEFIKIEFDVRDESPHIPIRDIVINKRTKEFVVTPSIKKFDTFLDDTVFEVQRKFHRFQNSPYLKVTHIQKLNSDLVLDVELFVFGSQLLEKFPSLKARTPNSSDNPSYVGSDFYEDEKVELPLLDIAHSIFKVRALTTDGFDSSTIGELVLTDEDIQGISLQNADSKPAYIVLKFKKSGKKFIPIESITLDIKTWNSVSVVMRPHLKSLVIKPKASHFERNCRHQLTILGNHPDGMGH